MTINLEGIFAEQARLQREVYGKDLSDLNDADRSEAIRVHVLALLDEIHEVLRETPWKPWKRSALFRKKEFTEELVDALHFFANVCLIGGVTVEDLMKGYEHKHGINLERQASGY